jgi:ankyrin repeat protein
MSKEGRVQPSDLGKRAQTNTNNDLLLAAHLCLRALVLALARAACGGDAETVARLVQAGTDPDAEGLDGVTPLIWAQSCDSLIGMEALLQNGADPNRPFYHANAVWIAAMDDRVEQRESAQLVAARFGATQVVAGSDYPFTLGDPDPVKTLGSTQVDAATLQGFFRDNALRFLGRT